MTCQQTETGFKCEKGKVVTISSPNDPTNPLIAHNWTVDGSQASTLPQFVQTFPNMGEHTVVHTGQNACGSSCSQTAQLEIVDVIVPPAKAAAPPGISPLAVVVVVALGFLGIVMMKKKK